MSFNSSEDPRGLPERCPGAVPGSGEPDPARNSFPLRGPTDTAHAWAPVPIYLVHSLVQPCCALPGCWCRTNRQPLATLLEQIDRGTLTVQEATTLLDADAPSPDGR